MPGPRYYEKNGKIYDAGVEISENEARSQLKRNAERRAKNAANVASAESGDPMTATMVKRMSELAEKGFKEDEDQLGPILKARDAAKAKK